MQDKDLKLIIAENICSLRLTNHMTQYELALAINYSDKAVSKWERGAGIPDAYVLKQLSKIFNVPVDYFFTEHSEEELKRDITTPTQKKIGILLFIILFMSVLLVAITVFVIIAMVKDKYVWQIYIYMLPFVGIVGIVFSAVRQRIFLLFGFISLLGWSLLTTVYLAIGDYSLWMLFLIGIPMQVIIILAFGVKVNIQLSKKKNPILESTIGKLHKKRNNE